MESDNDFRLSFIGINLSDILDLVKENEIFKAAKEKRKKIKDYKDSAIEYLFMVRMRTLDSGKDFPELDKKYDELGEKKTIKGIKADFEKIYEKVQDYSKESLDEVKDLIINSLKRYDKEFGDMMNSYNHKLEKKRKKVRRNFKGLVFDSLTDLINHEYPDNNVIREDNHYYLNKVSEETKIKVPTHYRCFCGVVKGSPSTKYVNTIGFLSGRAGRVSYCRLCGDELGFSGSMS